MPAPWLLRPADSPKKRKASGPPADTRSPPPFNLLSSGRSSISMGANYSYNGSSGPGQRQRPSQNQGHTRHRSDLTSARDANGSSESNPVDGTAMGASSGPGPGSGPGLLDRMSFTPQSQSRPPSSSHSAPAPDALVPRNISDARQGSSSNGNGGNAPSAMLTDGLQASQ